MVLPQGHTARTTGAFHIRKYRNPTPKVPLDSPEHPQVAPYESGSASWLSDASQLQRQFYAMDFLNMARQDPALKAETLDGYIRAARHADLSAEQIAAGLGLSPSEAARLGLDGKS